MTRLFGHAGHTLVLAFAAFAGVWLYFVLPSEPNVAVAATLSMVAVGFAVFARRWPLVYVGVAAGAMVLATVTVCALHARLLSTPLLDARYNGTRLWVTGHVSAMEANPPYLRLTLEGTEGYGAQGDIVPPRIRLSVHASRAAKLAIGDIVSAEAQLFAPALPAFDGDYNNRRSAFWDGIGASGMVLGDFYSTPPEQRLLLDRLAMVRSRIAARLGAFNGVAAALTTGVRGYVKDDVAGDFRASGLAHLMAISGLHVGMVAGMVFFGLQRLLALWPALTLHYPIRKIAAVCALAATFGYSILAGMSIPTMRALMMVAALLLAVMLDRIRSTLHILGLAAIAAVWLWPEEALGPSFQMSFIAALALVLWSRAQPSERRSTVPWVRRLGYMQGVWATSVVAGLATMPLAALHFGTVSLAGFITNLAAIPLMGFVVMPLALASLGGQFVGGITRVDALYAQSCQLLSKLAHAGASLDWVFTVPQQGGLWVLLLAWAGCLLYMARLKLLSFVTFALLVVVLFLLPAASERPDVLLLDRGATVLVRKAGNTYYLATQATSDDTRFTLKRMAQMRHITVIAPDAAIPCDAVGCVYTLAGDKNLLALNGHALPEKDDCDRMWLIAGQKEQNTDVCTGEHIVINYISKEIYLKPHVMHELVYTYTSGRMWQ